MINNIRKYTFFMHRMSRKNNNVMNIFAKLEISL
jgi:hypothetical protein